MHHTYPPAPHSYAPADAQRAARLASEYAHLGSQQAVELFMAAARLALHLPDRGVAEPRAAWAADVPVARAATARPVQALVDAAAYQPFDMRLAASMSKSIEAIFAGTQWLTAAELGRAYQPAVRNPHAIPSRWRSQGRAYAVDRRGQLLFPRYQFDRQFEPLPAQAEVLRTLAGLTPMAIASWFESPSSALGARRPRELLGSEPQRVIAAAADHIQGPLHG
jgi:hypothetical protein